MELEIDPSGIAITDTTTNTNNVAIDSSNIDISGTHKIILNDTNGISINNLTLQPTNTLGSATNITIDELAHLSGVSSNIQTQFNLLKGDAPAALDTIAELADAIGDNANFLTNVNNDIAAKVGKTGDETISGIKTIQGSLNFDTNGTISGDVIPVNNNLTNIGSASKQINAIHANDVNVSGDIHMNGNIDICGGNFTITNEELSKLDGVSDNIQSQINTAIAGNVWDNNGVKIHYNSGNVGIGTNDPTGKLEVHDGPVIIKPGTNATNALQFRSDISNTHYTNDIAWYDGNNDKKVMIGSSSSDTTSNFRFWQDGSQHFTFINDVSNTKVGINRLDPQYNLDVTGDINLTGTLYQNGSEFNPSLWSESTGNIYRSSGNVGIGTTNPDNKLSVPHTSHNNSAIPTSARTDIMGGLIWRQPSGWGGNTAIGNKYYVEDVNSFGSGITQRYNIMMRDDGNLWLSSPGTIQFEQGNGNDVMTIKNERVGIGDTSPSYKLDVAGDVNFTGNLYQNGSLFSSGGGGGGGAFTSGTGKAYYTGGNVGIGTTNPQALFHTKGKGRFDGQLKLACTTSLNHQLNIEMKNTSYAEIQTIQQGVGYNQNLCLQPVAGNVGIGTTNPTASLFINGTWNNLLSIKGNGSSEKEMRFFSGSNYCAIAVNSSNTEAITFQHSTGNVGIGTNNPLTYLHIKGAHPANTNLSDANDFYMLLGSTEWSASSYRLIGFGYIDGSTKCPPAYIGYKTVSASGNTYGDLIFGTRNGTGGGAPTERMRIRYNGQVGIGTTTPETGYKVHIKGSGSDSEAGRLLVENTNWASTLQLKSGSNSNYMYTNTNGDLYFKTTGTEKVYRFLVGSSEKMQISNTGNVGIGTSNPGAGLHINTAPNISLGPFGNYVQGTGGVIPPGGTSTLNRAVGLINEHRSWFKENVYFSSDERIKTDISSIQDSSALNIVNSLDTKEYHYIDPIRKGNNKTIGFIAQEVKEVLPNAVSVNKDFVPDEMQIITEPIWIDCSYSTIRYEPKTTYTETVRYEEGPLLDSSGNPVLDQSGNQIMDPSAVRVVDPSGAEHVDPSGIVIEEWHPKWKLQITDLDMSSNNTGLCRFYFSNDLSGNDETMKELALDPSSNNTFEAMDERYNNVFFYGKEVDDFHTLDKAQIFALHHSAIQELSRKNDALVSEKETMQTQITTLLEENNNMKSRLEALEAAIINLQNN